jgi:hypothetical protein
MAKQRDPRPGRRPRVTSGTGPSVDIGEANMEPVGTGFYDEPSETPASLAGTGTAREEDYRENLKSAASHVEGLPFTNLSRDPPVRTSLRGTAPVGYKPTGAKPGRLPR